MIEKKSREYEAGEYNIIVYNNNTAEIRRTTRAMWPSKTVNHVIPDASIPLELEDIAVQIENSGNIVIAQKNGGNHTFTNDFLRNI